MQIGHRSSSAWRPTADCRSMARCRCVSEGERRPSERRLAMLHAAAAQPHHAASAAAMLPSCAWWHVARGAFSALRGLHLVLCDSTAHRSEAAAGADCCTPLHAAALRLRMYAAVWRHAIGIRLARLCAQPAASQRSPAPHTARANLPATRRASRMRAPWAAGRAVRSEAQDGPSTSARQHTRRRTNSERTNAVAACCQHGTAPASSSPSSGYLWSRRCRVLRCSLQAPKQRQNALAAAATPGMRRRPPGATLERLRSRRCCVDAAAAPHDVGRPKTSIWLRERIIL